MAWTRQEIGITALLSICLPLIALVVLDVGLAIFRPVPDQRDPVLGWTLKKNFSYRFQQSTLGGRSYSADFSTNSDGLRVYGSDVHAPIRILVLGDSFTADPYASNDQMWYANMVRTLAQRLQRPLSDFYVLAGGGDGWGTYQEMLLSKDLATRLKPSLFVLEFCSNDFLNNSFEWERKSFARGQYMRRPYPDQDGKGLHYSPGLLAKFYRSFLGQSRLFNRIDAVLGSIQMRRYGNETLPLTTQVREKYERDSVTVTDHLLGRLRLEYRGIPAAMVNCDGAETGPNRVWRTLARSSGFIPLRAPSDMLYGLKPAQRGEIRNRDGAHLSDVGNKLYGEAAGEDLAALHLPFL